MSAARLGLRTPSAASHQLCADVRYRQRRSFRPAEASRSRWRTGRGVLLTSAVAEEYVRLKQPSCVRRREYWSEAEFLKPLFEKPSRSERWPVQASGNPWAQLDELEFVAATPTRT